LLVGLALLGLGIATYLALYQLGVLSEVWEPFFGDGSRTVLHSVISRMLPIPDSALGAMAYLADAIAGVIGGRARWRSRPWIVILFGLAAATFAAVSTLLVIFQGAWFHAWCTLCLASASISITIVGPALEEMLAALQQLKYAKIQGHSLWRAFWGMEN
jgi:uncharacterized membrane protein